MSKTYQITEFWAMNLGKQEIEAIIPILKRLFNYSKYNVEIV